MRACFGLFGPLAFKIASVTAEVTLAEEFDEAFHPGVDAVEDVEFGESGGEGFFLAVPEAAAGLLEAFDVLVGDAGALEADAVEAADDIGTVDFDEGGD